MANYLPTRESELVIWLNNFGSLITADAPGYGLTAEQATAYEAQKDAFVGVYQTANDPMTRSPGNIEVKNTQKTALIALTRQLVKQIQGSPVIDNDKRRALGITVPDTEPTPIAPPSEMPVLEVTSVVGWTVNLRMHNGESTRRRKPEDVTGAFVFAYVGETPPNDVDAWDFKGTSTRTEMVLEFPTTLPAGTKVWVTAAWVNAKLQTGPACTPVETQINYGGLSRAA